MDNHIHLLLHSDSDKLPRFVQGLGSRFVRWYNSKYSRTGHLFQGRFHSFPVETDAKFLATIIYIHNNPVKAKACLYPSDYKWSSHSAYYGAKNKIVNASFAFSIAGSREALLTYFSHNDSVSNSILFSNIHSNTLHFLTDEQALEIFRNVTHISSLSEASNLPKVKRNECIRLLKEHHLTCKQIARMMDVSPATVKRVSRKNEPLTPAP